MVPMNPCCITDNNPSSVGDGLLSVRAGDGIVTDPGRVVAVSKVFSCDAGTPAEL